MKTIEEVIALAAEKGRVVKACHSPEHAALDCGAAPNTNERMRMTAGGALLTVNEGRYWQVGTLDEVYNGLRSLGEPPPTQKKQLPFGDGT
jgi:hypothetical protein